VRVSNEAPHSLLLDSLQAHVSLLMCPWHPKNGDVQRACIGTPHAHLGGIVAGAHEHDVQAAVLPVVERTHWHKVLPAARGTDVKFALGRVEKQ
jgi:hypothetical protein